MTDSSSPHSKDIVCAVIDAMLLEKSAIKTAIRKEKALRKSTIKTDGKRFISGLWAGAGL